MDSSSEEDDSDESDYESSEDEADMSPLPKVRPTGAVDVVKYDCIKALWRPRSRPASGDDIRDGLKTFWDLFMTIRDRWKSDSVALKSAEESKKNHEIPLLKERVMKQRKMAETALRTAMEQGHPDIIEQYVLFHLLYPRTSRALNVVSLHPMPWLPNCRFDLDSNPAISTACFLVSQINELRLHLLQRQPSSVEWHNRMHKPVLIA